jgi:hypothetical protein
LRNCGNESTKACIFYADVVATSKRREQVPLNACCWMGFHGLAYILGRDVVPAMLPGDFFQKVYAMWRRWWDWFFGWHLVS